MKQAGYTQKALSSAAGVSVNTVAQCVKGANVSKTSADKIKAVLDGDIFEAVERNNSKLSDLSLIHISFYYVRSII